jgi:hypothetical protein
MEFESEACAGVANFDHSVDLADVLVVFDDWGLPSGHADVNHDSIMDVIDVQWVLWNFGSCL